MPQLVEDTILVIQSFKHDGTEYLAGDRVPTGELEWLGGQGGDTAYEAKLTRGSA